MAVALVELVSADGTAEATPTLTTACADGGLALVALIAETSTLANEFLTDPVGSPQLTPTGLPVDGTDAWGCLDVRVVSCEGGEDEFLVIPSQPGVMSGVAARFTGEALIPPYAATQNTGSVLDPETPAWTAADLGLVVAFLVIGGNEAPPAPPAGWTEEASRQSATLSWSVATRPIVATGAQAAETYGAPVTADWQVVVVPLYEPGRRLAGATGFSTGPAFDFEGSPWDGGEVSPPLPRVERALPPLPPGGLRQVPPLPPWLPGDGPYLGGG